jgi:hypothetical protein
MGNIEQTSPVYNLYKYIGTTGGLVPELTARVPMRGRCFISSHRVRVDVLGG